MSLDLATLGLRVDSSQLRTSSRDLRNFRGDAANAERGAQGFGRAAKASFAMTAGAAAIGAAFLGVSLGIGQAISTIKGFESSMSNLAAISRASEADLAKLRDTAMSLGSSTEFSATQAADGLTFLAMAGFSATEALAAIPDVLDLATASGMGLAAAADTASNIMGGFGLAANEAGKVADVLAAAASRSNTSVTQLGSAMSTAAPIARTLGVDLADTAAAIGIMSDAGIQGERAGTALRGVFASLAGPTAQARDVLEKYSLTAADVDPKVVGLTNALAALQPVTASAADAMVLFGREAASGALVLIESASSVKAFGNELRDVDGAAKEMAATMRDNLGGDVQGLISRMEGLILAIGDAGVTGALRGLVQGLTTVVDGLGFVIQNADILAVSLSVLGATYIPAAVASMAAMAGGMGAINALFIAGAVASQAMAVALRAIPFVAAVTTITALWRLWGQNREAAAAFKDTLVDVTKAQDDLSASVASFYDDSSKRNAQALHDIATQTVATIQAALLVAEAERQAALRVVTLFGAFFGAGQDRYDAATIAIHNLKGELVGAEAALSAAEMAGAEAGAAMTDLEDGTSSVADAMTKVTAAVYTAIPSMQELRQTYGDAADAARDVLAAQNELAKADFRDSYTDAVDSVYDLIEGLDMSAGSASALQVALNMARESGDFGEQATLASRLAAMIYEAAGGAGAMSDQVRVVYDGLLSASLEAAELAGQTDGAAGRAAALQQAVGGINFSNAVSGAMQLSAQLGVSLSQAMQLMGLLGAAAQAKNDAVIYDPRDPRYDKDAADAGARMERLKGHMADLSAESEKVAKGMGKAAVSTKGAGGAASKASGGTAKLTDSQKELNRAKEAGIALTEKYYTPLEKYADAMAELDDVMSQGHISVETYQRALKDINDELADSYPLVNSVADAFGDFVAGGLRDFESMKDAILGSFKSMLSQMIATAARNKIMMSMGVGGAGGAAGAASQVLGGASGIGGALGSLGSLGSLFMGNAGATTSAFLSGGLSAGLGQAGLAMQGMTASLPAFVSGLGAAVPIVGAVALAFMAFKPSFKSLDNGIKLTIKGNELLASSYDKVQKSRLFGLMKSTDNNETKIKDSPLAAAYAQIYAGAAASAQALGLSSKALSGYTAQINISTKGMDEAQAQEAAMQALQESQNGLAKRFFSALGKGSHRLIKDGEEMGAAMGRVAASVTLTADAMQLLGGKIRFLGLSGANAATQFVDILGGLENAGAAVSSYMDTFYTVEEKLAVSKKRVDQTVGKLFNKIPASLADYKKAVDAAIAGGNTKRAAELINFAPIFAEFEGLKTQITGTGNAAATAAEKLAKNNAIAQQRYDLDTQIMTLEGRTTKIRRRELELLDPSLHAMQKRLWALQDEAAATTAATAAAAVTMGLQKQIWTLQGNTNALRRAEVEGMTRGDRILQQRIWALEDEAKATQEAANAQASAMALQVQIWGLLGQTNKVREHELSKLNATDAALQRRIYRLEDEAKAAAEAEAAAQSELALKGQLWALQGRTDLIRKNELSTMNAVDRALQIRIWGLEDEAAAAQKAAEVAASELNVRKALWAAQGRTDLLRADELKSMTAIEQVMQRRIWAIEDEAKAAALAQAAAQSRLALQMQIYALEGNTAAIRANELSGMNAVDRALQIRIWGLEAEAAALAKAQQVADQRLGIQRQIWELMGDEDAIRRDVLDSLDASNHSLQEQYWALVDQKDAQEELARRADEATAAIERMIDAVDPNKFASKFAYEEALGQAANGQTTSRLTPTGVPLVSVPDSPVAVAQADLVTEVKALRREMETMHMERMALTLNGNSDIRTIAANSERDQIIGTPAVRKQGL